MRSRIFVVTASMAAFTLAAACGGNSDGQQTAATNTSAAPAGGGGRAGGRGGADRIVPVEIAVVTRGSITRTTQLTGTVEPIRQVGVNAQLGGAILSIHAEEGSTVAQGQVLARMDAREIESQLISASAALAAAEAAMERSRKLRDAQIITEIELERDRTALAAALSQHEQVTTRLGYATVRSPIAGVVMEKRVEAGDVVGSQGRLFTVADVSTLVVRVNVSELDVTGLRVGQSVDITIDALPDGRMEGRVRRIFPAADSITRLVPVEVALTGANARLVKPGFLVRTTFRQDARRDALLVPVTAVVGSSGAQVVFRVVENIASRTPVRTGLTYAGHVEILSGIDAGDSVIVAGNVALRDGATVRVVGTAMGDNVTSVTRDSLTVGGPAQPMGGGE